MPVKVHIYRSKTLKSTLLLFFIWQGWQGGRRSSFIYLNLLWGCWVVVGAPNLEPEVGFSFVCKDQNLRLKCTIISIALRAPRRLGPSSFVWALGTLVRYHSRSTIKELRMTFVWALGTLVRYHSRSTIKELRMNKLRSRPGGRGRVKYVPVHFMDSVQVY